MDRSKLNLIILLFFCCPYNQAQLNAQSYYDSDEFNKFEEERLKIDNNRIEPLLKFIDHWEDKVMATGDSMAIAYMWMSFGGGLDNFNEHEQAITYCLKAKGIIDRHSLDKIFTHNINYLAEQYYGLGQFEKAIECALQSIDDFNSYKPYTNHVNYKILSSAYLTMHNYERMDYYLQKWYALVKEKNIRRDLGFAIYNLHESYDIAKMYEKASFYQNEFYKFYADREKEVSEVPEHAFITISGDTPEETIEKLLKYLPYQEENNRHHFVSQTYRHLGTLYLQTGDPKSAIKYFEKAAKSHSSVLIENKISTYYGLYEAYGEIGDYKNAFYYSKQRISLLDSFKNMEVVAQANELEAKYENEKKMLQLDLKESQIQSKNKWLLASALGGLIVLGLAFFIFFLYRKLRSKNVILSKTISEKETLLQEIHHRVKNNLQVISSLLSLQSRYVKDENAISALNDGQSRVESMVLIHQNLYRGDNITGVSMQKYIPLLADNIFNTYNILGDNIRIEYDIDNISLDVETVIPIGLVLNELISNSLKYAFPNKSEGLLEVRLKEASNVLFLSVVDNGIGYTDENAKTGFGSKLIRSFTRKLEGELKIKTNNGTAIEILIKNYKIA